MKNDTVTSKNTHYALMAWILAALVLMVAVPLNLIISRLDITFDMSPNNLYTLSNTTKKYLDELEAKGEKVDVYLLAKMEYLEEDLEWLALYRTLRAYDAYDCFNLIDFDPDTDPQKLKEINPDNIWKLSVGDFLFVHGNTAKKLPASMMYQYKTDEDGNVTSAEFRAENYFTGYMKSVVDGEVPVVYFLEGHNEIPLSEMSHLKENLGNYNYGAEPLNLTTTENVPEDCCILVIAAPKYDLTEPELNAVNRYTQRGGNISLLMSPNEESTQYPNFEKLLKGYCIGMNYDRISESDPNRHSHTDPYAQLCDLSTPNQEAGYDLTTELLKASDMPTYMPYSRSFFSFYGDNYSTLKMDTLITTQNTAISEPWGGKSLDPQTIEGRSFTLAMYAEDSQRYDSKIAVFGSADIIRDEGTANPYFIMPLNLFLSTITWMYNSDVDMNIASKERTFDSLNINSSAEASTLIAIFAGYPVLIAAAGVFVWLRRKNA